MYEANHASINSTTSALCAFNETQTALAAQAACDCTNLSLKLCEVEIVVMSYYHMFPSANYEYQRDSHEQRRRPLV